MSQNALQYSELVLIELLVLVAIEKFPQVCLLGFIHSPVTMCENLIYVLDLGFKIIKLSVLTVYFLMGEKVMVVFGRVYNLGSLIFEQELILFR